MSNNNPPAPPPGPSVAPTLAEAAEVLRLAQTLFERLRDLPRWAAFQDLHAEVALEFDAAAASITAALDAMSRDELSPAEAMRRAVEPFDELVRLRARFNNLTPDA